MITFEINKPPARMHALLKKAFHYDANTGVWTRLYKSKRGRGVRADQRRFYKKKNYTCRTVTIGRTRFLSHRLAWFYVHGKWPPCELDHIDNNAENNIFTNLRLCPAQALNNANGKLRTDNTSGIKGVSWSGTRKKWVAYVNFEGRRIPLGRFADFDAAVVKRKKWFEEFYGEFARHA